MKQNMEFTFRAIGIGLILSLAMAAARSARAAAMGSFDPLHGPSCVSIAILPVVAGGVYHGPPAGPARLDDPEAVARRDRATKVTSTSAHIAARPTADTPARVSASCDAPPDKAAARVDTTAKPFQAP